MSCNVDHKHCGESCERGDDEGAHCQDCETDCAYCDRCIPSNDANPPPLDDDAAWQRLSRYHTPSCEWFKNRGWRMSSPADSGERP